MTSEKGGLEPPRTRVAGFLQDHHLYRTSHYFFVFQRSSPAAQLHE